MNKRNSQNVYLSALSLGDTINLQINFTIPLLRQISRIDEIFENYIILCKINGFLTEFFLIYQTWIIVLLTFERSICILWPLKCYSLYTHKRAKVSIFILALIVMCLSFYRFYDVKGIDQTSVFAITACDRDSHVSYPFIQFLNLTVWAILPEVLTLIMNLFIIYHIKLATQKFEPFYSKARQTKYNQATKTVLLISVLFLICHTPTGILIIVNLLISKDERTIGLMMVLVLRKLTVILYEISLCCKFFIYNQTFRNFK
jgi:succinate dehydrogenase hydrophobic anchor subunit